MKHTLIKITFYILFSFLLGKHSFATQSSYTNNDFNLLMTKIFSFNLNTFDIDSFDTQRFDTNQDQKIDVQDLFIIVRSYLDRPTQPECELCSKNTAWFENCLSSDTEENFFECAGFALVEREKCPAFFQRVKEKCGSALWTMAWNALRCDENLLTYSQSYSWQCAFTLFSSENFSSFFDQNLENSCLDNFREWDEFLDCNSY